ncbi:glycoside hydrolase [Pelomonas sp. Root1217]|uniref:glycoside hydrolase family 16 protein n=1 Tax=Pelomonas sp. Root1217 TaxID=1736430 RepID=UPI00070B1D9A|nr:glycoside hydrolase family 16 protein [Pelomonas sp. Root1217]KQV48287.1 glycoside hydrolase [Pelomonas sp. Root1217]
MNSKTLIGSLLLAASAVASASVTSPVIGKLLWSEEFNGAGLDSALWSTYDGNGCQIGLCGYGNQELEYYRPDNLSIVNVPFEPATRALAITARREVMGANQFTSGKLDSAGKVQVKYGMVEIRAATPSVGVGLWPALWMLGTGPQAWPRKGEIDMMEQGGRQPAGLPAVSPDQFVGANVITFNEAACVPGNESCAASTAWQTKNWVTPSRSLANRFVLYRLYWTDTQIRFTMVDNGRELDMYKAPISTVGSPALQEPFYLLMNMAVGGNFTPAATPAQVTAPLPATMYVDYVRVYELDGKGEVKLGVGITPEAGKFGVFTDNTPVTNGQALGTSADFFIWNTGSMGGGNIPPFEGSNVLALNYFAPGQWFGGAVQSRQVHDMSGFRNGNIKLKIKVPANVAFKIGILDTYTNHSWVTFPANTTAYGLVRNGEWGTATIPVAEIAGPLVALQSMNSLFEFLSVDGANPGAPFQMAFDDIIWDSGVAATGAVAVTAPATAKTTGVPTASTQTGATTLELAANATGWVDAHYTVNGGETQTVRMRQDGSASRYTLGGLKKGDVVEYRFTSWDSKGQVAVDTASKRAVMK